jgi:tetratricopeptide (TPR) repeat protein
MKFILLLLTTRLLFPAPVTFNKDIAPIVFQNCSPCHRPGEIGPFSLLSYQDVRKHARQIGIVTRSRYMPPWPPADRPGSFENERRLTPQQIDLIAAWLKEGTPEGSPGDPPARPHFTEGWALGPPDLILKMPKTFPLPANGSDIFRNFVVPVNLEHTRYVRAVELRPGGKNLVHHASIIVDRARSLRYRDGEDGQPGFPGMDVVTASAGDFDPDSHFLFWKPGSLPQMEPPDMSWRLDPGTDLIINLHLQPSGKPELIQSEIGLYFSSQAPTRFPMLLQLEHDGAIDILPGSRAFTVTDQLTLPVDVNVLSIYPHAHYLGKEIEAWATLPDGSRRQLILIKDWDINWQAVYTYRYPVFLPKGSTVRMRVSYDNSANNPRNPNSPPKRVRTGNRAEDEMGHVWLQVLPKRTGNGDPRMELQEALMRRRLEKYPDDFLAEYNLGAVLQLRGESSEAVLHLRQAVKQEPSNAGARNTLGAALLAGKYTDDAIREFGKAIELDPTYLEPRLNLALVYLSQGLFDQALPQLREAARLRPNDADIQSNLGTLLAMRHDLPAAISAFERALKINPDQKTARANLAKARTELAAGKARN